MKKSFWLLVAVLLLQLSCQNNPSRDSTPESVSPATINVPRFDSDSAYSFVAQQVLFGPRAPKSIGHQECRSWIINQLESFDWSVTTQEFETTLASKESITGYNIIGSYRPELSDRILLGAHWDSRFMADQDSDPSKRNEEILGADDGASGVGVLLEVARIVNQTPVDQGIDIVFFDLEDQGSSSRDNTWCLGAQHWAQTAHSPGYKAKFGILLDMVGAKNAQFRRERAVAAGQYDANHAAQVERVYERVWKLAQNMGYSAYFNDSFMAGLIIDDHYFVNKAGRIPMIDIINRPTSGNFADHWHTVEDNLNVIDKRTLRITGQVVLAVIYRESVGLFK